MDSWTVEPVSNLQHKSLPLLVQRRCFRCRRSRGQNWTPVPCRWQPVAICHLSLAKAPKLYLYLSTVTCLEMSGVSRIAIISCHVWLNFNWLPFRCGTKKNIYCTYCHSRRNCLTLHQLSRHQPSPALACACSTTFSGCKLASLM